MFYPLEQKALLGHWQVSILVLIINVRFYSMRFTLVLLLLFIADLAGDAFLKAQCPPVVIIQGYDISCEGMNDGRIVLKVESTNQEYDYRLFLDMKMVSMPAMTKRPDGVEFSGLKPGKYYVTGNAVNPKCPGEDENSFVSKQKTLKQPQSLKMDINKSLREGKFAASAIVSGGTPPYRYEWKGIKGGNTWEVLNLKCKRYKLSVTDANQCSIEGEVIFTREDKRNLKN